MMLALSRYRWDSYSRCRWRRGGDGQQALRLPPGPQDSLRLSRSPRVYKGQRSVFRRGEGGGVGVVERLARGGPAGETGRAEGRRCGGGGGGEVFAAKNLCGHVCQGKTQACKGGNNASF
ncbi:expressed unknown protein [Ectocarpus siliculosus]|uniref:Uncharacterized protein n=1 Tax=Ectocarpus siliculosus TaxID=2880 RepID=D7FH36_ECTSI|nr:expressed unknown protein [Ectocarpus siliculosus]|eukprot:CBJ28411.1 expressed unknown protein [Ectocarpus siliculosus]